MYIIAEGMANVLADPTAVVIMAFIAYGFGSLQCGCIYSAWHMACLQAADESAGCVPAKTAA